ncbi:hypothetical protein LZC95_10605 [Pendulispora brunnea]|uniref:Uncharacterized protein n=1 Tax=Pendulispora brunnea TaxID=2905690 RepID=A0ABZ2KI69_9BACT
MPSKPLSGKRLVLLGAGVIAVLALGIFLAFAFIGRKQLVRASFLSEGRRRLGDFGEGLAHCAVTAGLPPSSPLVPAEFDQLKGPGYQSTPQDWAAEAFRCAHFAPTDATSHFQIGWKRHDAESGEVQAFGDVDQDGRVDTRMTAPVKCTFKEPSVIEKCGIGPVQEEAIGAVER